MRRMLMAIAGVALFSVGIWAGSQNSTSDAGKGVYPTGWQIPKASEYKSLPLPAQIDIPDGLFALAGAAGLLALLFAGAKGFARRRRLKTLRCSRAAVRPLPAADASHGSQYLERVAHTDSTIEVLDAPRVLLENPYGAELPGLSLEDRVKVAAEASLRHSRTIGLILFDTASMSAVANGARGPNTEIAIEMCERFATKLRPSDGIADFGGRVGVFISLLKTKDDLAKIAARLLAVASQTAEEHGLKLENKPGTAMYPIDGYGLDELLQSAQMRIVPMIGGEAVQPQLTANPPTPLGRFSNRPLNAAMVH
ncbi:MAG: hypothetical protein AB7F96_02315 [Beijerinckiaceae bacterium]